MSGRSHTGCRCWVQPRIRGKHHTHTSTLVAVRGPSSRTRESLGLGLDRGQVEGFTPACARSTAVVGARRRGTEVHPRVRGKYWLGCSIRRTFPGPSPHMQETPTPRLSCPRVPAPSPHAWGTRVHPVLDGDREGSITTYVESTSRSCTNSRAARGHPCVCRKNVGRMRAYILTMGSSPRTREASWRPAFSRLEVRSTPAYAGGTWGQRRST